METTPRDASSIIPKWRAKAEHYQARIPLLRSLTGNALAIVLLLFVVNVVVWKICAIILAFHTSLAATAVLAWTLGLRHALDADHLSAIDLITRRLIASSQRPVTVVTFFSLGHSTIVIITSVVGAIAAPVGQETLGFSFEGGGLYPLGVMFGLGFDTSSGIALIGNSFIEAAPDTSIWLILIFPLLFTAGMCFLDTFDRAAMMSVYTSAKLARDPIAILYYQCVLTAITVVVAIVIGIIKTA
ncbi:hypothetical protein LTR62_002846 [Meristemomyces frigidus]|uniref:Nickel/cobalt efflux system n=1 Tax=Meristemomyces frigidus TaxID=1508187 RepID=A0AAN7TRM6_9PEZI|nr:hypothetical protein LTR62_002846 [Meristemomyces frigidus]